jgi:acetyltransferase
MMEQTKIYKALLGVRGRKAVDMQALERLLVRFSRLVAEQPQVSQIDINPLLASSRGLLALDARVILHEELATGAGGNKAPEAAIRPYPMQYASGWTMKNGEKVLIRPIRPDDEPLMVEFHRSLSDEVVHQRYFGTLKLEARIAHSRLRRICFNDYDREIALVVEQQQTPESGKRAILGVARLSKSHDANQAEFAIVLGGPWQGLGLGTELLQRLVQIGRAERLDRIVGQMLPDNHPMINVSRRVGFTVKYEEKNGVCAAELVLGHPSARTSDMSNTSPGASSSGGEASARAAQQ